NRPVRIQCPADCAYLASAREHPAAVVVRQQHQDVSFVGQALRDFSDRQSELFFLIVSSLVKYQAPGLHSIVDDDVADAMAALAGTFETAARGVIYDHRPASLPAERLVAALKPIITEAGRGLGSSFERDAAAVMRRIADTTRDARAADQENRRAFLDLLGRVLTRTGPNATTEPAA